LSLERSYLDRTFEVVDSDARLRDPADILRALRDPVTGEILRLSQGLRVAVDEVKRVQSGGVRLFAHVRAVGGSGASGWTSTANFAGRFIGETLERIDPALGAGAYAATAAWESGKYIGQISLIEIVDATEVIEVIADTTAAPFLAMCAAAQEAGVAIQLTSGFRTWAEQKQLREGWEKRLPGYYPAAKPGSSNHQNGVAFDIRVRASYDSDEYLWLALEATAHGFLRTVSGEPHHWEYRPDETAAALAAGRHKRSSVNR